MIRLPRIFRIETTETIGEWAPKVNELVRDAIAALRELAGDVDEKGPAPEYVDVTMVGAATDVLVNNPLATPPKSVQVCKVVDRDAGAAITNAVWAHWDIFGGQIRLRSVSGLTGGTNYTLTLQVVEG